MNSKQAIRQKLYKNNTFYEPQNQNKHVRTQHYEKLQHQKETPEFQQKKKSTFIAYQYSSSWNPLYKKHSRVDPPYKELHERKQRVPQYSDKKTDPLALKSSKHEIRETKTSRPQYKPSREYKIEHQLRYVLPKNRQISQPRKVYHNQLGMNVQGPPGISRTQRSKHLRNNSSLMKLSLDYSQSKPNFNHNRSVSYFKEQF